MDSLTGIMDNLEGILFLLFILFAFYSIWETVFEGYSFIEKLKQFWYFILLLLALSMWWIAITSGQAGWFPGG